MAEKGLTVGEGRTLSAVDIRAQVNLVQQVMKAVMKVGEHYGKIPGCGDKLTLFKSGAEKLLSTFRIAAEPVVEDLSTHDEARFRVTVRGVSQASGIYLGSGVGECSSSEEKYKWKKAVCDQEWEATPEDRRREKWFKGYNNGTPYQVKQIRTNPADVANTVLKMAKKRGQIDMTLTVTAASDIFTQDIEDPEDIPETGAPAKPEGKPHTDPPKTTEEAASKPTGDVLPEVTGEVIKVTPYVYNKTKVVDGKTVPDPKHKTSYLIKQGELGDITVDEWRKPLEGVKAGSTIKATNVKIGEYKGATTYTAEKIEVEVEF